MPLDHSFDNDSFKRRCIGWQRKISFLPRKCYYTGKSIWLKKAYKGTEMITGPGTPVFDHRWVHPQEYLFLKIKGLI
jgi:hypothetical protein